MQLGCRLSRSTPGARLAAAVATLALLGAAGCGTTATTLSSAAGTKSSSGHVLRVVAAENFWGSIAAQLGGTHAQVTSLITNPNADPHAYEPTMADARTVAAAQMVIYNGLGYDPWTPKLLAADGGTATVLDVGRLLGLNDGDNPHRWYNPADVRAVVDATVADYSRLDPADAPYFRARQHHFLTVALHPYDSLIEAIRARYAGTPVGASESIFSMLAPALGLDLITPPSFLRAISEGTDVSAADKATIDRQIEDHQIKVYVVNGQNITPDVQAQLGECKAAGIPTATITETLTPASATYQSWQVNQLRGLLRALEKAARR